MAANSALRTGLRQMMEANFSSVELLIPPFSLCGDNAAMIGAAAYPKWLKQDFANLGMNARPGLSLS